MTMNAKFTSVPTGELRDRLSRLKADMLAAKSEAGSMLTKGNATDDEWDKVAAGLTAADEAAEILAELGSREKSAELFDRVAKGLSDTKAGSIGAGKAWAAAAVNALEEKSGGFGVKALLSGEVSTPPQVEVAELPDVPTRLLDLIPRQELNEATFAYLRQTGRINNAAVVADGALKPTSTFAFQEIEDKARVVAHLSEAFPLRYLSDHETMINVLGHQMAVGIWEALEEQIVNGDGTGENFTGILEVAGTTDVPFATDVITTLRTARTVLESKGERVTGVAMHPDDVQALDMTREDGATGGFLLGDDTCRRIFGPGVQGVASLAVPEGTAILGDFGQTRLRVRENVSTLSATQSGELFDRNQVKLRTEGRFGFQVSRPQALAVVALAAA